jgi:hypothetical protein
MTELINKKDALSKIFSSEIAKINEFIESDGASQLHEFGRITINLEDIFGKDIKNDDVELMADLLEEYGWDVDIETDVLFIS